MDKAKLTAFENASVLRKFTIFFMLMSVLPVGILYYFYCQLKTNGRIEINEADFKITLYLVIMGVLVGFWAMRVILKNIIDITRANRESLKEVLGEDKFNDLSNNNNEVAVLARSFSEITNRLEENVKSLELAKKTLHSVLAKIGKGLSSMQNIDSFLEVIIETVADALNAKVGILMLMSEDRKDFYVKSAYGMVIDHDNPLKFKMENTVFSGMITSKRPLIIPNFQPEEMIQNGQGPLFLETPILCSPLLIHENIIGIIFVSGRKTPGNFKEEELNLLYNLALQTAVAIENSNLNLNAERTYFETISALALAVEAKDQYSRGHLDRVADYAVKIAQKLNLSESDIQILRDGARLHDLGKIGILDEILRKPDSLTPQEWEIMKKHTEIGEGIIKPIKSLSKLCDVVRHHHEKLDGSGYPDGLKGEEISMLARILCVADIFDALTTDRPYRKAFSIQQAKEELIKMKGKLDPKVVYAFLLTL